MPPVHLTSTTLPATVVVKYPPPHLHNGNGNNDETANTADFSPPQQNNIHQLPDSNHHHQGPTPQTSLGCNCTVWRSKLVRFTIKDVSVTAFLQR
jgi:hypothetical protein